MRSYLGGLGAKRRVSGDKTRARLGIRYRSGEEAVAAMGKSLIAAGAV
jgi:hypothetical protein